MSHGRYDSAFFRWRRLHERGNTLWPNICSPGIINTTALSPLTIVASIERWAIPNPPSGTTSSRDVITLARAWRNEREPFPHLWSSKTWVHGHLLPETRHQCLVRMVFYIKLHLRVSNYTWCRASRSVVSMIMFPHGNRELQYTSFCRNRYTTQ